MQNTDTPIQGNYAHVKGIIFDYGGTIDSRGDHWSHIIAEGWSKAGINVPIDVFRHAYVAAERAMARHRVVLPGDNFDVLMHKKARLELDYLAQLITTTLHKQASGTQLDPVEQSMAQSLTPGLVDTIADPFAKDNAADTIATHCYIHARTCVREAQPVLETLAKTFPLVLVSNFYGNVDEVIRDMGIRNLFRGVIESAVVGVRKPDPAIFALGVTALGIPADNILVVGDSLRKDILPARSLGCATAWIKGRGWTPDEDAAQDPAQIPALSTLPSLLGLK